MNFAWSLLLVASFAVVCESMCVSPKKNHCYSCKPRKKKKKRKPLCPNHKLFWLWFCFSNVEESIDFLWKILIMIYQAKETTHWNPCSTCVTFSKSKILSPVEAFGARFAEIFTYIFVFWKLMLFLLLLLIGIRCIGEKNIYKWPCFGPSPSTTSCCVVTHYIFNYSLSCAKYRRSVTEY